MFMAQDGGRTFTIEREDDDLWSVWCHVGWATLALASDPPNKLKFETPERCVALFRDASGIGDSWTDFIERIQRQESGNIPLPFSPLLGEENSWCGPVNVQRDCR
jgi:hypothetical protein